MDKTIKIYKDKSLTEEIEDNTFEFGILLAGESKQYTFWVVNSSEAYLKSLEFIVDHNEIKIIKSPKELSSQGVEELILEWSPSVTLKEGLKAILRIKGIELWG